MFNETTISLDQRFYGSFLDEINNNNNSDNISSIIKDKEFKNKSYSCLECNKSLKILLFSKEKIVYTCDCKKDDEAKYIKDLVFHELGEKELSNIRCEKHNNKKFEFYCFDCGENLCSKCQNFGHKHNNIKKLNDIQNIGEKIEKLDNEMIQRYNYNQNDLLSNSLTLDTSFNYEDILYPLPENEVKFITFCKVIINYFKDYSTYSQIESLNKIYEFVFSLKLKYKFNPGSNILFGEEFYNRNKNNFILKINEKQIENNKISVENEQTFEGILIMKEGKKLDNLSYMFCQVSSIFSIRDIHFLDDSLVKDMNKMDYIFYNCTSLKDLYPPKWNSSIFKRNMIYKCPFFKNYNESICNMEKFYESPNNSFKNSFLKIIRNLCFPKSKQLLSPNNDELKKDKLYYFIKLSFKIIFIILILIILLTNIKTYDNPVVIKKEIWKEYETKVGAYYILYSPLRDDYSKIIGDIRLPILLNTNKGKRIAYITLGVVGLNGRINIGIINSKFGWTPYFYDIKYKKMKGFRDYICPEETEIVKFKLELVNSSKIIFSLKYFDSNSVFLNSFITEIDASHILVINNNKTKLRFYRYIQLRPTENDNQNDGTYMKKGEFKELYIVKKNLSESWGIMGKNVDVAWKVSSRHIKLHFKRNKEIFSINHK